MADAPLLGGANDVNRSTGSRLTNARNVDSHVFELLLYHAPTRILTLDVDRQASLRLQDPARWIDSPRGHHICDHHDSAEL